MGVEEGGGAAEGVNGDGFRYLPARERNVAGGGVPDLADAPRPAPAAFEQQQRELDRRNRNELLLQRAQTHLPENNHNHDGNQEEDQHANVPPNLAQQLPMVWEEDRGQDGQDAPPAAEPEVLEADEGGDEMPPEEVDEDADMRHEQPLRLPVRATAAVDAERAPEMNDTQAQQPAAVDASDGGQDLHKG